MSSKESIIQQLLSDPNTQKEYSKSVHKVYNWFNNADEETLSMVRAVLQGVSYASTPNAESQAAFWTGFVTAKLEDRFNLCPNCQTDHNINPALEDRPVVQEKPIQPQTSGGLYL